MIMMITKRKKCSSGCWCGEYGCGCQGGSCWYLFFNGVMTLAGMVVVVISVLLKVIVRLMLAVVLIGMRFSCC